jgi:hypothetical protein
LQNLDVCTWPKLAVSCLFKWQNFLQFLNQHSMTSKTVSQIFPVMFQSLLKPHYVYTSWFHKISPPLIVCRICSINSIRNPRHGFWSILKCSHGTFVTFIQENWVPRGKLQLLRFFHYNFWHKMSTLNEISSCIGTPRGLVFGICCS